MVRKIGNVFSFFCLYLFTAVLHAEQISIETRLLDEQGREVAITGIGIPVILEVIVRGTSSPVTKLFIDGIKNFDREQQGTTRQVSTVNGKATTKTIYRYMIRAKQEGVYTIGPVQAHVDTEIYNSPSKTLEVKQGYKDLNQKVALEVIADKQQVFVGERMPLRIRFYKDKKCELLGVDPLELHGCKMSAMQGPFSGVAQRNGTQQKYIEWQTSFVAQNAGEFTIPALRAHYKELSSQAGMHSALLGGLFDFGYTQKSTYSSPISFTIQSLPAYQGKVHGIGSFNSLRATLNQQTAKQGEGVVLSLELEGEGDFDAIVHPELQLPPSLTYYDSKTTINTAGTKKTFEYIIQAKEEGLWEIPSQNFVFFDIQDRTYKKLQTEPLSLIITTGLQKNKQPEENRQQELSQIKSALWPLQEYQPFEQRKKFPIYMFWLGFFAPLAFVLLRNYRSILHVYSGSKNPKWRKKKILASTRKKLKALSKTHDTSQLYTIFVSFIAHWQNITEAEVSQEIIRQKLVRFSQATVAQWDIFFVKIMEQAYSNNVLTIQEKEELFKNAFVWLSLFEKI